MDIVFKPIGFIRSPHATLEGMPIQPAGAKDIEGSVVVNPMYEEGLEDLDGFSRIFLFYFFHKSKGFDLKVKPFMDTSERGLFSTRAPRRPNPLGISVVELLGREGNILHVRGVDILDQTPIIDIKPYVPRFDSHESERTGWLEKNAVKADSMRSDKRFASRK